MDPGEFVLFVVFNLAIADAPSMQKAFDSVDQHIVKIVHVDGQTEITKPISRYVGTVFDTRCVGSKRTLAYGTA